MRHGWVGWPTDSDSRYDVALLLGLGRYVFLKYIDNMFIRFIPNYRSYFV